MLSLSRLQEYLRFKARQHHEMVSSPPFLIFFHANDSDSESNYAIPDASGSNDLPEKGDFGEVRLSRLWHTDEKQKRFFAERNRSMEKKTAIVPELVNEFVARAHSDLQRVQILLEREPLLINAAWDWGDGDWETALGAAAH